MSGWRCHERGRGSGIGPLLSRNRRGGVAQLARRYSGLVERDMGELDNTHYGAREVRQLLHGKGEAASTVASACCWGSRLARSRQIEASEQPHRHCGAALNILVLITECKRTS
jgi:hypothetical protein